MFQRSVRNFCPKIVRNEGKSVRKLNVRNFLASNVCPRLNANEIQSLYDKHHKVSSLVKSHQNTHNPVKYENV